MQTEVFGVFGDPSAFQRLRSPDQFDRIVTSQTITVGVRDPRLDTPGRTATYHSGSSDGCCVVWGEAHHRSEDTAKQLYHRYRKNGMAALDPAWLNGSYLIALDAGDEPFVGTDPIRSRDCFYADTESGRVFGSNATEVARTLDGPTLDGHALAEFIHCGLVVSDRTPIAEMRRIPFDGYITPDGTDIFTRFVYLNRVVHNVTIQAPARNT